MLAGTSAASTTMGSVVEDVETVVGTSSDSAFALETTIASAWPDSCKKCCACGRICMCQNTLYMDLMHVMDSNNSVYDVSSAFYAG